MENATKNNQVTMSESEFCKIVGISRTMAYYLRRKGKLAHYRLGKKVLYGQEHITQFLKDNERPSKPKR